MAQTGYKESYKKYNRFATFTHCLRFASVLAHAHNYLSALGLVHVTLVPRPCDGNPNVCLYSALLESVNSTDKLTTGLLG